MERHSGLETGDDAALVEAARGGDRDAFAQIYDRYADRLHDYCWSLLRNRDEAADATQDTFVLAAERLGQIRDPSRLRPWLYAVARSQALRRLRARDRILDPDGEQDMATVADPGAGPEGEAEQADLQRLVWDAAAGLSERDRSLLDLHLRHGLEGAELGEAMGVNVNHAYVLLTRVRDQVERSLGALLVARMGREDCEGLAAVLEDWDGRFSPLTRKRVARHVDGCEVCGDRRRTMVNPPALLAAVPMVPAPAALRDRVLASVVLPAAGPPDGPPGDPRGGQGGTQEGARQAAALAGVGAGGAGPDGSGSWPGGQPPLPGRPRVSRAGVLSLVVLLALVVGGVAAVVVPDLARSGEPTGGAVAPTTAGLFQPGVVATPEPSTSLETTTSRAPSTTAGQTATSARSSTSTSTTTAIMPVRLGVAPRGVTLGPSAPRVKITLTNPRRAAVAWEAVASDLWFAVDPTGGTVKGGGRATIVVAYNPTTVRPPAEGTVLITWDGGQASVPVRLLAPLPASTSTSIGTTTTTTTTNLPG